VEELPVTKKYVVHLSSDQRQELEALLGSGTHAARVLTRARILLKADAGAQGPAWTDSAIATALEVDALTVSRVRQRFVVGGLARALQRQVQERRAEPCLDGAGEAHLLALVCGSPPEGRARWTLRLLAHRMVVLGHAEHLSYETVRQVLKRGRSSPGNGSNGASHLNRTGSL
jgi:hypothetical protein